MTYIVTRAQDRQVGYLLGECTSFGAAAALAQRCGATGRPRAETTDRWRMTDARGWVVFHIQRR